MLSAADRDEPHGECAEVLRTRHSELVIATPVVTETAWMIESRLGPAAEACATSQRASSKWRSRPGARSGVRLSCRRARPGS